MYISYKLVDILFGMQFQPRKINFLRGFLIFTKIYSHSFLVGQVG